MRLSIMPIPELQSQATEPIVERPLQLIPITHVHSGNGPIYCRTFRNMQQVICDGLQEYCPEVFLPSSQDITRKCKVGYPPGEVDIALQFLQNSTYTLPQRFFHQTQSSLVAYTFSETKEDMEVQTSGMMNVLRQIFQKLELKAFYAKDLGGNYVGIMTPNLNGTEPCFYSPSKKVGFYKRHFSFAKNGLGKSEKQILQEFGLKREELKEAKTSRLVEINTLGKRSPDYEGFVSNKQKLSCFVVKYELNFKNVMDAIICNSTGISGLIWPKAITPFKVLLVCSHDQMENATVIYEKLLEKGISVLFDDRDIPLAEKVEWAEKFGIYEKFILDYIDDVAFFC